MTGGGGASAAAAAAVAAVEQERFKRQIPQGGAPAAIGGIIRDPRGDASGDRSADGRGRRDEHRGTLRGKEALPGRLHFRELLHRGELGGEVRVESGNRLATRRGNVNRLPRRDLASLAFLGANHHRPTRDVKLRAAGLGIAVEHRSPNADGGDSGVDFIGALFGMPRGEAERALRYVDGRLPV